MPAGSDPAPTTVVAYVPDLMDRSRVEVAGHTGGLTVVFVAEPADLVTAVAGDARLVLVDLAGAGVLDLLPALGAAHTIGFASHIERALLAGARAAGCDEVLPRSAVFRRLARGVAQEASDPPTATTSTATSRVCDAPPPSTEPRNGDTSK